MTAALTPSGTGPGIGALMTSDAAGNPSWADPGAISGLDWINAKVHEAVGDGITDDTAAINAALAAASAAGGGTVYLPWGVYLVSGTLSIPPNVFLVGQTAVTLNLWSSPPPNLSRIVASASWAPSATTGIVSIQSKTPGCWSTNTQSCGLRNLVIDGSQNTSTNLNGIYLLGPVYDVHLDDVFVWKAPHNGIHAAGQAETGVPATYPYHQRYRRVTCANSGNVGFNVVNFTDSEFDQCLGFASAGNAWTLQNNSNSQLRACRGEWSTGTGRGFDISGTSGSIVLSGCTTDQNACEGLRIHGASGQPTHGGGIIVNGGKFHADGNAGTNPNGIKITGSTAPVVISGANVESGQNGANWWPTTALEVDTSSNVTVAGSILQGISNSWVDGGGNSYLVRKGCIGMTGTPGAQSPAILPALPAMNVPLPEDQNLIAWTYDSVLQTSNSTPTSGVIYLARLNVRTTTPITNLLLSVAVASSGLTAGQNFAGLYNSAGTLLSATADQTTAWGTTGLKMMPLAAAQTVAPGVYYLAILANSATTTPGFARSTVQGAATVNAGTSSACPRYATSGTGQTALPASITIPNAAQSNTAWWGAFS